MLSLSCFAQEINDKHQLLWEISGNGIKQKSFLFGSLHSNEKQLFNLTDSTYFALDQAKTIVLEADIFSIFDDYDTRQDYVEMNYDNDIHTAHLRNFRKNQFLKFLQPFL